MVVRNQDCFSAWHAEVLNMRAGQLCRICLGSETSQCYNKFSAVAVRYEHFYFSTKSKLSALMNCF